MAGAGRKEHEIHHFFVIISQIALTLESEGIRMKKWLVGLIVAVCMTLGAGAWAQPQIPPVPTGGIYVQDYAGVLSGETKTKINQLQKNQNIQNQKRIILNLRCFLA